VKWVLVYKKWWVFGCGLGVWTLPQRCALGSVSQSKRADEAQFTTCTANVPVAATAEASASQPGLCLKMVV
jgi:hypothetical protein